MQEIGKGDAIVVVISDKYLRSPNCMYEIVQIQQNGDLFERIFPIVLADADIYRTSKRVQYIKHWATEVKELNESMKGLDDMSVINEIQEELSEYRQILNSISQITTLLKNMNTPYPANASASRFRTFDESY
jgi:internalin A